MRTRAGRMRVDAGGATPTVGLQPVSSADPAGGHERVTARLVRELLLAVAEASTNGFYRMARLLEECSVELDDRSPRSRGERLRLIERARQCLEFWAALREW